MLECSNHGFRAVQKLALVSGRLQCGNMVSLGTIPAADCAPSSSPAFLRASASRIVESLKPTIGRPSGSKIPQALIKW